MRLCLRSLPIIDAKSQAGSLALRSRTVIRKPALWEGFSFGYGTNAMANLMSSFASAVRHNGGPRFYLFLAVLAVLGATLVLLRQALRGFTLPVDSVVYVSVARNLLQGDGFVHWNGAPLGPFFPPGYPLWLAAASWSIRSVGRRGSLQCRRPRRNRLRGRPLVASAPNLPFSGSHGVLRRNVRYALDPHDHACLVRDRLHAMPYAGPHSNRPISD